MALAVSKRLGGSGLSKSHARAVTQEKQTAARIGGRTVVGSGSKFEKGDVRLKGVVRIEAKTTKNASFSVTEAIIDKLEQACFGAGEVPILQVEILGGKRRCLVIPDWALDDILEALKAGKGKA